MKVSIYFFFLATSLAFGQLEVTRVDLEPQDAALAWQIVESQVPDAGQKSLNSIAQIKGATLVREPAVNGWGEKVWLTFSATGTYLLQAVTCNGSPTWFVASAWTIPDGMVAHLLIVDTEALRSAIPFYDSVCAVNAFRLDGSSVEMLHVTLGSEPQQPLTVYGESISGDGEYELHVSANSIYSKVATISVGRGALASGFQLTPDGNLLLKFPAGSYLPEPGLSTLTICQDGACTSQTFVRRVPFPSPSGKG